MKTIALLHPHGGMGDLLLSYPVIQTFANAYPESRILYVIPPGMEDVVKFHPAVYEVIPLQPGFLAALKLSRLLRAWKTDLACALWSTGRIAYLLKSAGIPIRIGQAGRTLYSSFFTHQVAVRSARGDQESHWVECLLDYPRALGLTPANKTISLTLPESAEQEIQAILKQVGVESTSSLVVMHCGKGEHVQKRNWPLSLFASAADELSGKGFTVVFTGSPGEVPLVESIQGKMRSKSFSVAGETDFVTLAALLKLAKVMVCPDSGPMHAAAAVGTPVAAIFAMKKDFPKRWTPWGVKHIVLRPKEFPCRPWCTKENCPDFRCYHEISPSEIVKAVESLV